MLAWGTPVLTKGTPKIKICLLLSFISLLLTYFFQNAQFLFVFNAKHFKQH
jgi:hypothetical protein